MKNQKFIFVYFGEKELCSTAEEAIAFINNLNYRGTSKSKLVCNSSCERRIRAIFSGGDTFTNVCELTTSGCSTTRIKVYPALADTLEHHERLYAISAEKEKAARLKENSERLAKINAELDEQREGLYLVDLTYKHFGIYGGEPKSKTYIYRGQAIASSGREAYQKTISWLNDQTPAGENGYPEPFSNYFDFEFLREKMPNDAEFIGHIENLNRQ